MHLPFLLLHFFLFFVHFVAFLLFLHVSLPLLLFELFTLRKFLLLQLFSLQGLLLKAQLLFGFL